MIIGPNFRRLAHQSEIFNFLFGILSRVIHTATAVVAAYLILSSAVVQPLQYYTAQRPTLERLRPASVDRQ